tara:strand:- start:429 stop:782 length:354 start_codon:yes stop_codon:yes gene_type:complete
MKNILSRIQDSIVEFLTPPPPVTFKRPIVKKETVLDEDLPWPRWFGEYKVLREGHAPTHEKSLLYKYGCEWFSNTADIKQCWVCGRLEMKDYLSQEQLTERNKQNLEVYNKKYNNEK